MNSEVKEKWLKALKSGEYKQGCEMLHPRDGSFCCLGVLTDLYLKERGLEWEKDHYGDHEFNGAGCLLPNEVRIWAGLESEEGWEGDVIEEGISATKFGGREYTSLAIMNDKGETFEEIAKIIEEKL